MWSLDGVAFSGFVDTPIWLLLLETVTNEDTLNTFSYLRKVKSRHDCRVRTSAQPYSDGEGRDVGDEAGTGREEGGQG